MRRALFDLLFALAFVGCSSSERGPSCIDAGVTPSCTAAYEPTYDALYTNTFQPTCAKSTFSCHAAAGRQGGLDFDDREGAYAALLQHDIVRKGEPACSTLVHRVTSLDGKVRMPPGASIPLGEQCAIVQWIANGAPR